MIPIAVIFPALLRRANTPPGSITRRKRTLPSRNRRKDDGLEEVRDESQHSDDMLEEKEVDFMETLNAGKKSKRLLGMQRTLISHVEGGGSTSKLCRFPTCVYVVVKTRSGDTQERLRVASLHAVSKVTHRAGARFKARQYAIQLAAMRRLPRESNLLFLSVKNI